MNRYKTVMWEGSAEQTIERSKFTARVKPVSAKEEADAFIARIKAENRDAAHNVPAMVLGEKFQIQWANDDGEPQGTAGAPIVHMLVKEGVTNVAVVVTRIFGGIKLGTGGLIRAYTDSAKRGLAAAGICQVKELAVLTAKIGYPFLDKARNLSRNGGFEIIGIRYEDAVLMEIAMDPSSMETVRDLFADMTAGGAIWLDQREELRRIPIDAAHMGQTVSE